MSFTRVMSMSVLKTVPVVAVLSLGLAGCLTPEKNVSDDFGAAVHTAIAAQIADPEARYVGKPDPGTDAAHVQLAQDRYHAAAQVIKPARESQPIVINGEGLGADTFNPDAGKSAKASGGGDSGGSSGGGGGGGGGYGGASGASPAPK